MGGAASLPFLSWTPCRDCDPWNWNLFSNELVVPFKPPQLILQLHDEEEVVQIELV